MGGVLKAVRPRRSRSPKTSQKKSRARKHPRRLWLQLTTPQLRPLTTPQLRPLMTLQLRPLMKSRTRRSSSALEL